MITFVFLLLVVGRLPEHPSKIKVKPIEVTIPACDRMELKNGIVLYSYEDHELPLINIIINVNTGTKYDPQNKEGLANIVGEIMREGGTASITGEELNEELEKIGALLKIDTGTEEITITLSILSKHLNIGLKFLAEILMQPAFPEDKIEFKKLHMVERIARRKDNPRQIASEEFVKLIYNEHSYGNKETEEALLTITQDDIIAFHSKYFVPNNIIMGVIGNFDKDTLLKEIENALKLWERKDVDFPQLPELKRTYNKSVTLIEQKTNQSNIHIGHIAVERTHQDYFPIILMNSFLSRRVYESVRRLAGLAYVASAGFRFYKEGGHFVATTQTKSSTTCKAITLIVDEMKKLRKEKVAEKELEILKQGVLNGFVFWFEEPSSILNRYMEIEYYGLPTDYLVSYRNKVIEVTADDILRVAREYLRPDDIIILVLGESNNFEFPLSNFGEVNLIK